MISAKGMEFSPGEMAVSMTDSGAMESNTDAEYLSRTKVPKELESGRMVATLNG